ncbi:MAG TPA: glycosyltransferase [Pyrinomonadaceae bacterium]|nr:glycosyltransferase [Pyrinomonadaceae bacterium]
MATQNVSKLRFHTNRMVQGLWVGSELSQLEQLSIASFLANGHEYHLFTYEDVRHVPAGTTLRDANEILPSVSVFQYTGKPSYAGFANFFRYKLLLERGGWWVDTDTVCLRAFDFPEEYVFSSEIVKGFQVVNCGAIKTPPGSQVMAFAWQTCQAKDPAKLIWGETGPRLMGEAVNRSSLNRYVKPYYTFCPFAHYEWRKMLEPNPPTVRAETYAIHLWNEKWREVGQDKNGEYPPGCLYERLKKRYFEQG